MKTYDYYEKLNLEFKNQFRSTSRSSNRAVGELKPHLAVSTSFGAESAVLPHMVTQFQSDIPVLFTNTGFHFPQTLNTGTVWWKGSSST